MRHLALSLVAALTLSTLAFAGQPKKLNLPVGHSATLSMPGPVSKVTVADPSLLDVQTQGRRLVFVAQRAGRTDVTVKTSEGEMKLSVYVAADKYGLPY